MKKTLSILSFVFFVISVCSACNRVHNEQANISTTTQKVFLQAGDTCSNYYGDLKMLFILDSSGTNVLCEMYLSSVFVGIHTLTTTQNQYNFDLQVANYKTQGKLILILGNAPQVSKVSGDFTYTVIANNESYTYRGDIIFWYINK